MMATARDLALIDRLWRQWSPSLSLDPALQAELHEHLRASMPAPLEYYRAMLRPGMLAATRRLSQPIAMPLLQLHGADDGCILPPQVDDRHRFAAPHALEVVPDVGHFLHIEAPEAIAERIAAWGRVADHSTLAARPPGWAARGGLWHGVAADGGMGRISAR